MAHPMKGEWHSLLIQDDGTVAGDGKFFLDTIDEDDTGKIRTARHERDGDSKTVDGNIRRVGDRFRFELNHVDFGSRGTKHRNYLGVLVLNGPIIGDTPVFSMVVGRMKKSQAALEETKSTVANDLLDQEDGTVIITRP